LAAGLCPYPLGELVRSPRPTSKGTERREGRIEGKERERDGISLPQSQDEQK